MTVVLREHLDQRRFEADYARAEDELRARLARTAAEDAWLQGLVAGVAAPDEECARAARARFDAAAMPLGGLGLLDGRLATCHPGWEDKLGGAEYTRQGVVTDGNITTGRGVGFAIDFGLELVRLLVLF